MATSGRPSAVPPNQADITSPGRISTTVEAWQEGVGMLSDTNSTVCAESDAENRRRDPEQ